MDVFEQDKRGFNWYLVASLVIHGVFLLVVWGLPREGTERLSPPPLPVYIVQDGPAESEPRPSPIPPVSSVTRPAKRKPPAPPSPAPPMQTPRPIPVRPQPLPDLPMTDDLTDRPPSSREPHDGALAPGKALPGTEPESGFESETAPDVAKGSGKGTRSKIALYDPGVVGKIVGPATSYPNVPEVTLDTAEFKHLSYMQKLRERIENIWIYPPSAIRQGVTGDLFIRFVILADGSLGEVSLVRTSGYPELDNAALEAVRNASPFLPLPQKWGVEAFAVKGHFFYSLSGYYIR